MAKPDYIHRTIRARTGSGQTELEPIVSQLVTPEYTGQDGGYDIDTYAGTSSEKP